MADQSSEVFTTGGEFSFAKANGVVLPLSFWNGCLKSWAKTMFLILCFVFGSENTMLGCFLHSFVGSNSPLLPLTLLLINPIGCHDSHNFIDGVMILPW